VDIPETITSANRDPNLFVHRPEYSQTRPHLHLSSADLGEIEAHLAATQVEPGISYFNARRELWLNGKREVPRPGDIPASITKLEEMVGDPQALRSRGVWEAGLGRVSKRLIEGGRLKYNLPMRLLVCSATHSVVIQYSILTRSSLQIKILYAGWIRDGTWPPQAQTQESDGVLTQAH